MSARPDDDPAAYYLAKAREWDRRAAAEAGANRETAKQVADTYRALAEAVSRPIKVTPRL